MDRNQTLSGRRLAKPISDYDPLLQKDSSLRQSLTNKLNFSYISRRLQNMKLTQRAIDIADDLTDLANPQSLVMIGLGQKRQGNKRESEKNLLLALQADPNNQQARYGLIESWFTNIRDKKELPEYICLLYTSPSPRDRTRSRMPSSA